MIYNEDCLKVLKTIKSESVDCVVTDPPYKIMSRGSAKGMGGFMTNNISLSGKIFDNNDIEFSDYLPELYRILKDGTHCYIMINNYNLIELLNEAVKVGFKFVKSIIWDKKSKICGNWYMGCYEYILLFRKGEGRPINNPSTPDILSIPVNKLKNSDGTNMHDTEKPVELMKILIENSTNKGELVLDPFMGIGATGVACVESGREFIGCEIDSKYFDIAKNRIEGGTAIKDTKEIELF